MAAPFIAVVVSTAVDVYATDPHITAVSVAVLKRNTDAPTAVDVHKLAAVELTDRRLTGQLTARSSLPDLFYGFSEVVSGDATIANFDGALDFLRDEDNWGQPVRIRRVDEDNNELTDVFTGAIERVRVGDEVSLSFASHQLDIFDTVLPRHRVFAGTSILSTSPEDIDVSHLFPEATDLQEPISLIFGRVPDIRCPLVQSDETAFAIYHLVGEDALDIDSVRRDGVPLFRAFAFSDGVFTGTSTIQLGTHLLNERFRQPASSAQYVLPSGITDFYRNLYIHIRYLTSGRDISGRHVRRCISYDATTRTMTVDVPWSANIGACYCEIREYEVDTATFPDRTTLRFPSIQRTDDGALAEVTATAVRYEGARRNLLAFTEDPDRVPWYWDLADITSEFTTPPAQVPGPFAGVLGWRFAIGASHLSLRQWTANSAMPANGTAMVFSVWLRADAACNVILTLEDSLGNEDFENVNVTTTWTRFSVTHSAWGSPGNNALRVEIAGLMPNPPALEIYGPQLEVGSIPSTFEPTADRGQGSRWSVPDAIAEVLTHPRWGLGLQIDVASFAQANADLEATPLKVQGSVPMLDGATATAKELLDSWLMLRGMRLINQQGVWALHVDQDTTSVGILGSIETPYRNIRRVGALDQIHVDDLVKKLTLLYGAHRAEDASGTVRYAGEVRVSANPRGIDLALPHAFIQDQGTAVLAAQYLAGKYKMLRERQSLTLGQAGRVLQPGDIVTLHLPRQHSENRLLHSEDVDAAPWSGTPAVSYADIPNPEGISQRVSVVNLSSAALTEQTTGIAAASQHAYFMMAVRTTNTTGVSVTLILENTGGTESFGGTFVVGDAWQILRVHGRFTSAATGTIRVGFLRGGATTFSLFIARTQLSLEYPYRYRKTGAAAIVAPERWQIIEMVRDGVDTHEIVCIPFDAAVIFAASPYEITSPVGIQATVDATRFPPEPPTNVVLPPSAPAVTAAAGADVGSDGAAASWALISYTAPTTNCVRIDIQRRLTDAPLEWEIVDSQPLAVTDLGTRRSAICRGFVPGRAYDIRLAAVNVRGLAGFTNSQTFIAHGDTVGPVFKNTGVEATSDRVIVTEGGARTQIVRVALDGSGGPPADWALTRIYRMPYFDAYPGGTPPGSNQLVFEGRSLHYADVVPQAVPVIYYYWAVLYDHSGNYSKVLGKWASSPPTPPNGATTGITIGTLGKELYFETNVGGGGPGTIYGTIPIYHPTTGVTIGVLRVYDD